MIYNSKILGFIFLAFFFSCAQQTSPTGGPKDEASPILLESSPTANQLNFKGKVITLTFNEDVIVSNPKEQLIITPDIGSEYEVVAKKNKVILTMQDQLLDTTTYAFNFGESVQDITEKNPAENLHVAFSTGPTIDSLSVEGYVYDLLKGDPIEKAVVAVYQSDTFNIFKHKPAYISRTNKEGNFRISNLKAGTYYIYAYRDKNRNLLVDSKSEHYGYLVNPIILTTDTTAIEIATSPMDATELVVTRARPFNNYFTINLSKNITDYSLITVETSDTLISTYGENQANIITYNTTNNTDSLFVKLNAIDSIGNTLDTTFFIKYSQREVTPEKFSISNQNAIINADKGAFEATFKMNKPIKTFNLDSIFIYLDSTTQIHFNDGDLSFNYKNLLLTISKSFDKKILEKPLPETTKDPTTGGNVTQVERVARKRGEPPTLEERANMQLAEKKTEQASNILQLGKGAFISIDNDSSARSSNNIKVYKTVDLALLIIKIETEENFIVNLLNKDYQVVKSEANNKNTTFEDVLPGDYKIQLIIDRNKNGKWDAGNIFTKTEPEPIVFYINLQGTQNIPAKANWEVSDMLIKY